MQTAFLNKARFDNEQWRYICEKFDVNPDCGWFEVMYEIYDTSDIEDDIEEESLWETEQLLKDLL